MGSPVSISTHKNKVIVPKRHLHIRSYEPETLFSSSQRLARKVLGKQTASDVTAQFRTDRIDSLAEQFRIEGLGKLDHLTAAFIRECGWISDKH